MSNYQQQLVTYSVITQLKLLTALLQTQPIMLRHLRNEKGENTGEALETIAAQIPAYLLYGAEAILARAERLGVGKVPEMPPLET